MEKFKYTQKGSRKQWKKTLEVSNNLRFFKNNELTPEKITFCDQVHFQLNGFVKENLRISGSKNCDDCESKPLLWVRYTTWAAVTLKEIFIKFIVKNITDELYWNILQKKKSSAENERLIKGFYSRRSHTIQNMWSVRSIFSTFWSSSNRSWLTQNLLMESALPSENISLKISENFCANIFPKIFGDFHRFSNILLRIFRLSDEYLCNFVHKLRENTNNLLENTDFLIYCKFREFSIKSLISHANFRIFIYKIQN